MSYEDCGPFVRRSPNDFNREGPTSELPALKGSGSGRRSQRSATRYECFGQRMKAIAERAVGLFGMGGEWAYQPARVTSTLKVWGVPEGQGGHRPPLGSSSLPNSQEPMNTGVSRIEEGVNPANARKRPRKGMKGMPRARKRFITELLTLCEEIRPRLCLWTINLPDEDYEDFARLGTWSVFQRRVNDRWAQYLRAQGDECIVLGVVELGPKRSSRLRRPIPHLHIVSSGWHKKGSDGDWLVNHRILDQIVHQACADAGLPSRNRSSASNVDGIKRGVRAYVGGYLKKSIPVEDVDHSDGWESLIPKEWTNSSAEARAYLAGHTFRLPPAFVAFVLQQRKVLDRAQLGFHRVAVVGHTKYLGSDRPIEIECFRFWSPEHLARAYELFYLWCCSEEAFAEEAALCPDLDEPASQNEGLTPTPLPSLIC